MRCKGTTILEKNSYFYTKIRLILCYFENYAYFCSPNGLFR